MVAHDLKSPLTTIIGYTQLLQQSHDTMDTNDIDHDLQTILTASTKMTTIINELLRLAMVGRSDPITDTTLDMAQIVDEATMRLAPMIGDAHALLSYPPTWPVAHGHAPWVEEVWVNYVSNALKYGGTPPHMVLGADAPSGGFVRFWIRDNGSGITKEQQDLLFNTFTRLQPTRASGHGLGLSIVSRIVRKLGGTVGVESTIGVGSTFFFTLPAPE
jgi:signal transduction histidine kinase